MGERIRLETSGIEVTIPDGVKMGEAERQPSLIVSILKQCNGDVDLYCKQFTTRNHTSNVEVMIKTLQILDKAENHEFKQQWNSLIDAFKQAKLLMAQNKAIHAIANYNYPKTKAGRKSTQMTQDAVIKLTTFWYKGWTKEEEVRGKKRGDKMPTTAEEEVTDPLDAALADMQSEDE